MQCFAKLARKYSLAVVTSHDHVSCDVLYLFHQVYVLAKGGFCVYCGPPENIHQFLTQAGIDVKDYQMPVDVLLKIASDNHDRKACRVRFCYVEGFYIVNECTFSNSVATSRSATA